MSNARDALLGSGALATIVDVSINGAELLLLFGDVAFYPASIAFGTIAPTAEWLSPEALEPVVLFLAVLYVSNLLIRRVQRFRTQEDD